MVHGGDGVATGDLNMDDIKETFRQVFQGQAPGPSKRADPGSECQKCKVLVNKCPVALPKGLVYDYYIAGRFSESLDHIIESPPERLNPI